MMMMPMAAVCMRPRATREVAHHGIIAKSFLTGGAHYELLYCTVYLLVVLCVVSLGSHLCFTLVLVQYRDHVKEFTTFVTVKFWMRYILYLLTRGASHVLD